MGEFGSVYNGRSEELPDRLRAMDDQLAAFEAGGAHWTAWTYKDVGTMGWVTLRPESEYGQRVARLLELKRRLGTDSWTGWLPASEIAQLVEQTAARASAALEDPKLPPGEFVAYLKQAALDGFFGGLLQPIYAEAFRGLSENEIDRVLSSFALEQCRQNEGLSAVLRKHMAAEPTR